MIKLAAEKETAKSEKEAANNYVKEVQVRMKYQQKQQLRAKEEKSVVV